MHTGKSQSVYKSSPVITAEYLAGQMYHLVGEPIRTNLEVIPSLEEHQTLDEDTEGVALFDLSRMSQKGKDYMRQSVMLEFIARNFDYDFKEDEEKEVP